MSGNHASIKNKMYCTGYDVQIDGANTIIKFTFEDKGKELNGEFINVLNEVFEKGSTRIIVDLSTCEFPSFKIWGNLLEFYKKLEEKDGKLCIVWNPEFKLTLYNLTRLSKIFKIYPTQISAIKHLN